jgi:transcriptional regulator with XRE-family HTH domain
MRRPEASFASPLAASVAAQLGGAIRGARLGRNLTQGDFAQRARVSLATLQRIERGDPAVSFTSWLSALEASSLLNVLKAAAEQSTDAVGGARRQIEQRQRASRLKTKAADPMLSYAF